MEILSTIEHSAFSTWVREGSSIFGYYGFLFLHTVGLAIVVGISVFVDLRIAGVRRNLPLAPLEQFFPVVWVGFWISAASGMVLLAADATAKLTSLVFWLKMLLVALAVVDTVAIRRVVFRDGSAGPRASGCARLLAASSMALWFAATAVGRIAAFLS